MENQDIASATKNKRVYKRKPNESNDRVPSKVLKKKSMNDDQQQPSTLRKSISKKSPGIKTPQKRGGAQQRPQISRGQKKQQSLQQSQNDSGLASAKKASTTAKANPSRSSLFNPHGIPIVDKLGEFARNYLQNPPRPEEPKKKVKLIEDQEWVKLSEVKRKYFDLSNNFPYLKVAEDVKLKAVTAADLVVGQEIKSEIKEEGDRSIIIDSAAVPSGIKKEENMKAENDPEGEENHLREIRESQMKEEEGQIEQEEQQEQIVGQGEIQEIGNSGLKEEMLIKEEQEQANNGAGKIENQNDADE